MSSRATSRRVLALTCAFTLLACRTTTIERDAVGEAAPSVIIEPVIKTRSGDKLYAGGLLCQLVRKEGDDRVLVASISSSVEDPVRMVGLRPGAYRLSIKGGGIHKITEEFELDPGVRLRVRIDLELARRLKAVDETLEDFTPGGRYLLIRYSAGPVFYLVGVTALVVVNALATGAGDDEDDEEGDRFRQELGIEPIQSAPSYDESLRDR